MYEQTSPPTRLTHDHRQWTPVQTLLYNTGTVLGQASLTRGLNITSHLNHCSPCFARKKFCRFSSCHRHLNQPKTSFHHTATLSTVATNLLLGSSSKTDTIDMHLPQNIELGTLILDKLLKVTQNAPGTFTACLSQTESLPTRAHSLCDN